MRKPNLITETIHNITYDIKAEAIIGDLIQNGFLNDDFIAIHDGSFKRRYGRDIDFSEELKLENGQKITGIHLNRDGLYDSLPEGLFHQKTGAPQKESDKVSGVSKKLKAEEKAARNFFLPFENEIFFQRIHLELEERKILSRFSENLFDDIFPEFWNLDKTLDRKYIRRMVMFLHFSHQIAGNLNLTAKCLESILKENVTVKVKKSKGPVNMEMGDLNQILKSSLLGSVELGNDFVSCSDSDSISTTIEFNIGPLKSTDVCEYLVKGSASNFLSCFYDYFLPADLDVLTNILIAQENQHFVLVPNGKGTVLGYETAI